MLSNVMLSSHEELALVPCIILFFLFMGARSFDPLYPHSLREQGKFLPYWDNKGTLRGGYRICTHSFLHIRSCVLIRLLWSIEHTNQSMPHLPTRTLLHQQVQETQKETCLLCLPLHLASSICAPLFEHSILVPQVSTGQPEN